MSTSRTRARCALTALALSLLATAGQSLRAQAQVSGGVSLQGMSLNTKDSIWTFVYAAANPGQRFGVSQSVQIDVYAPTRVGHALLPMPSTQFLGDATALADADAGHVALAAESPKGAWSVTITDAADVVWRASRDSTGITQYLMPGHVISGFRLRARGVPLLRTAVLVPFLPMESYPDEDTDVAPVYVYPAGTWAGVPITTVLPGPGLPRDVIGAPVLRDQFALACKYQLIAPAGCATAQGILVKAASLHTPVNARVLKALLAGPSGGVHPYVQATIARELDALP